MTDRSVIPAPAAGAGLAPAPGARLAFPVLGTVQVVLIMSITMLAPALPLIQQEFGLTTAELALVNCAYGASFSGVLLLGGRLADSWGRRRTLTISVAGFVVTSVLAGLAPGLVVLIGARFLQGVAAALAAPAAIALLTDVFPEGPRRARAVAAWGTLATVGAVGGILVGGVVVSLLSWRWMFAVVGVLMLFVLAAVRRVLPHGPDPVRSRLDIPGAVLVTAGLTIATYGLLRATDQPWSSAQVWLPVGAGAVLLGAFVVVEARTRTPLVPLSLFRSFERVLALLATMITATCLSAAFFFLSLYFEQVRGFSALRTSAAFLPLGVALVLAGFGVGLLLRRAGSRVVAAVGLLVLGGALLLLGSTHVESPYLGLLLIGLLILPVGASLSFAGATVSAVSDVPDDQAGLIGGVLNAALETGPTIGLAALVAIAGARSAQLTTSTPAVQATTGYAFAFTVGGAAAVLLAGLTALSIRRRSKEAS